MTRGRSMLAAALLLVPLGGCGDDPDPDSGTGLTAEEQTAADNLAAQIVRSEDVSEERGGEDTVTQEQATCIAEGAVTEVGLEVLQDYGIVTDDGLVNRGITGVEMTEDDADALAGVFVDCLDAEGLFEEQLLSRSPGEPSEEARRCVDGLVDADSVREILSMSFQGRTSGVYDRLQDQVLRCTDQKGPGRQGSGTVR